jgi:tripartite-type tricarboxylate transporter receptor subunit TctC
VPLVVDLGRSDEQQQIFKLIFARQVIGRPFLGPPNVPKDRVDALRKAFAETMRDPEFLAEAVKSQLEITPVAGEEVDRLVKEIYRTPKAVADRAAAFIRQ